MSREEFDLTELFELTDEMLHLAEVKMPKQTRRFLQLEGNKLRRLVISNAKKLTKERKGKYLEGIKRGKVYKYGGDITSVRVYGSSPHAHLIEYGHRQVTKSGKEVGFVKGKRVFERSRIEFEDRFQQDCQKFVDKMLDEGLSL